MLADGDVRQPLNPYEVGFPRNNIFGAWCHFVGSSVKDKRRKTMPIGYTKSIFEDYPEDWPSKEALTHEIMITKNEVDSFEELIKNNSAEKIIDGFLVGHPSIFTIALDAYSTGHHGSWVFPKQMIRPRIREIRGLIPDFLIGGKSSDGFSWWVVEVKGANETIFAINNKDEIYFSGETNKGLCQLLEYVDFCSESQSNLRDSFKLQHFREPNGILLIGRDIELEDDKRKQNIKASWNRATNGKLEIRTYDWILRSLRPTFERLNEVKKEQ
jgi:hypothetical protein